MKLSFVLVTHKWNEHADRLLRLVSGYPDTQVVIHHDDSQSRFPAEWLNRPNILKVEPFRRTAWARTSAFLAQCDALELAFKQKFEADYFILLSGACYPIKSYRQIVATLEASTWTGGHMNLNPAVPGPELPGWWHTKVFKRPLCRIPFLSRRGRVYMREVRIRRRDHPFSEQRRLLFGSQWFILTRAATAYFVDSQPHRHPVTTFISDVEEAEGKHMSAEECVTQSILGESSLSFSSDTLRFIDWTNAVNWHPNVLTTEHWPAIRDSNSLFARKFDVERSRDLLDQIDRSILAD